MDLFGGLSFSLSRKKFDCSDEFSALFDRYSVGLILAYCYYYQDASLQTSLFLAHPSVTSRVSSLQTPQLSTLLIVFSGLALLIFAAVMVFIIVRNALGGVTTYEAYTLGRWKTARRLRKKNDDSNQSTPPTVPNVRLQLYVPVYETIDGLSYIGATVSVDPDRGIYDFGRRENLRNWIASDNLSNLIGKLLTLHPYTRDSYCYLADHNPLLYFLHLLLLNILKV